MYTSPDDARSDLFLAGAVFVFGPIVLRLLLQVIPVGAVPGMGPVLSLAVPAAVTAAVPIALSRYRREGWAAFGLARGGGGFLQGVVLAAPLVVASLAAAAIDFAWWAGMPLLLATSAAGALALAERLVAWIGLALLAAYVTGKARDAFRMDFATVPDTMLRIGRVLGIVLGVAALLRLLTTLSATSVLLPLAAAVIAYFVWRNVRRPTSTGLGVLLAPTVLLAVGSFFIAFSAAQLVEGVWAGAIGATLGLVMGALRETRTSAWAIVGLAVAVAALTSVPAPLRLGLM